MYLENEATPILFQATHIYPKKDFKRSKVWVRGVISCGKEGWAHSPMLYYAHLQTCHDDLWRRVELAQHEISVTSSHESNDVRVESIKEKYHGTSHLHWAHTDLGGFKTNFWAGNMDGLSYRFGDLGASDGRPIDIIVDCHQWHVGAGVMSL